MQTWTIVAYPAPSGNTYQYGIVNAPDEATARQMVLDRLAAEGVNVADVDPAEIGLIPWPTDVSFLKLVWG